MSFYSIMFLRDVPADRLDRVIVPDLVQRDIESLCDDPEEIEGGEDALRWVCDQNGISWEWKRWDRKQRERLIEKLVELTQHGVFIVLKKTFDPACPVFHQIDGTWQLTWDGQRVYAARRRFAFDLERRNQEEQERKAWQARNQPPKLEVLEPAVGPGTRPMTLGPHETDGKKADPKQEITNLMRSADPGDRQKAIDKTIEMYGINMSGVKSVKYDPSLSDNGVTSQSGVVRIGAAAFTTASPGWLGSTLGHEIEAHIQGQALKGNWWTDEQGTAVQEVQAYDYEIANAERYGLSKEEIEEVKYARSDYYRDLNAENKVLTDKGDFSRYKP